MSHTRRLAGALGATALASILSMGLFAPAASAAPQPIGPPGLPCATAPGPNQGQSCNLYDVSSMLPGPFNGFYEITCTNPTDDGVTICRVDTANMPQGGQTKRP